MWLLSGTWRAEAASVCGVRGGRSQGSNVTVYGNGTSTSMYGIDTVCLPVAVGWGGMGLAASSDVLAAWGGMG